jgi:hypothetical protein
MEMWFHSFVTVLQVTILTEKGGNEIKVKERKERGEG